MVYTLTSLASGSGPGGYAHSSGVESGVKICRVKYAELPAVARSLKNKQAAVVDVVNTFG